MMRFGRRLFPAAILSVALAAGATVPRRSPELVIRGQGSQALLSQFKGKVVLLAFLLTG